MLSLSSALLMIVDVQGRLAQAMHEKEALFKNLQITVRGAQLLQVPIIWVEQNPKGLGSTIPEIASLLTGVQPIPKMTFSAWKSAEVQERLRASGRKQVLLVGIEAHVCIYLTAADLLSAGYAVEILADAVSSRSAVNREIGLAKAASLGASITCSETVLFELLGTAEAAAFKPVVQLLK
jgi:hypothetical protein